MYDFCENTVFFLFGDLVIWTLGATEPTMENGCINQNTLGYFCFFCEEKTISISKQHKGLPSDILKTWYDLRAKWIAHGLSESFFLPKYAFSTKLLFQQFLERVIDYLMKF